MKFKIGNFVRCINPAPYGRVYYGEICEVVGIEEGKLALKGKVDNNPRYNFRDFELIDSTSELDLLIETANKGAEAIDKLDKYRDQLYWTPVGGFNGQQVYRFSKRPKAVPPPVLPESWPVTVSGNPLQVHIGCKTFDANTLKYALTRILKDDEPTAMGALYATRNGIKFEDHILSWVSAELLYKYLQEVLK